MGIEEGDIVEYRRRMLQSTKPRASLPVNPPDRSASSVLRGASGWSRVMRS